MFTDKPLCIVFLLGLFLLAGCQPADNATAEAGMLQSQEAWPAPKKEHKPWARWWWMGSAVDEKNLALLLEEYQRTGIGGLEIAPIYGAKGYEDRYLEYLSPEWIAMLDFVVRKSDSLGLGIDLTQGTGWPFGGPMVKPEDAATRLIVQKYPLKAGERMQEKLQVEEERQQALAPPLVSLVAYGAGGERLQLLDKVAPDGSLDWTAPAGEWELWAAFGGKTLQQVKRAAPGGAGYTLDHLSRQAVSAYLSHFDQALQGKNHGVRAFYNDSYEVYGADFSPRFFDEFQKRRGYDLRPYLKELLGEAENKMLVRLKSDYRETMSDLLLEHFTQAWTASAHQKGSLSKNQAHGSTGNILDLYAAVDIPEAETFGSSFFYIPGLRRDSADIRNVDPDPIMLKFASSAANTQGKRLASAESFTWLGEHFKTSLSQTKPELEQLFLSGINHVFYHGITYSPQEVAWPGWLFYASLNLTPANSLWPHLKGLNAYIQRTQSVLQAGTADNELLVYWPVYDVWAKPDGLEQMIKVHDIDEWLHPTPFYKQVSLLMEQGYSLDFVSDKMLQQAKVSAGKLLIAPASPGHQVLIVPRSTYMLPETFRSMLALAAAGATVVLEELPTDVPGHHQLEAKRKALQQAVASLKFTAAAEGVQERVLGKGKILLSADVPAALKRLGVMREALTDTGLKFIRRKIDGGKYYYLVNHTPKAVDTLIPLNLAAEEVLMMDPQTGKYGLAFVRKEGARTKVKVQLAAGEALILKALQTSFRGMEKWAYLSTPAQAITLDNNWQLTFTAGGPALPTDQKLPRLLSWTKLADEKAKAFSGSATYSTTFTLPATSAGEWVIDLGEVRESARLWVNEQEVGLLWSIPFRARIGQYLKPGENKIRVEVANLMANRIREMDRKGIEWRRYHEINFVNINYQPFDASGWEPVPSGLLGPVTLTPYRFNSL